MNNVKGIVMGIKFRKTIGPLIEHWDFTVERHSLFRRTIIGHVCWRSGSFVIKTRDGIIAISDDYHEACDRLMGALGLLSMKIKRHD